MLQNSLEETTLELIDSYGQTDLQNNYVIYLTQDLGELITTANFVFGTVENNYPTFMTGNLYMSVTVHIPE